MLVIVLLSNGMLQNIVRPIAFGATLDLNALLVLVVTIGAGGLFGMPARAPADAGPSPPVPA